MTQIPTTTITQDAGSVATLALPLLMAVCYIVLIVWLIRWLIAHNKRIQLMNERLEHLQHTVDDITRKLE